MAAECEAEVERLRAALMPFAHLHDAYFKGRRGEEAAFVSNAPSREAMPVGHLRRAARSLAGGDAEAMRAALRPFADVYARDFSRASPEAWAFGPVQVHRCLSFGGSRGGDSARLYGIGVDELQAAAEALQ